MESKEQPLVSVCCLVYNHAPFLRECFEGFVMQKTNFLMEILVHDDASTDGSQEIIKEYTAKYPNLFKPIYQTENQYSKGRSISVTYQYPRAKGKYIALCEGDDYWTDPYKLQKQVDFLEQNEKFSICFHDVKIYDQQKNELVDDFITEDVPSETTIYDLMQGNYIHTPSVVFRRNESVFNDLEKIGRIFPGDFALHLLNARYGKIKKISETMAVYRYGVGVWSKTGFTIEKALNILIFSAKMSVFCDDKVIKQYFAKRERNTLNYIVDEIERLERVYSSKAYRLGKFLLKPFSYIKSQINK